MSTVTDQGAEPIPGYTLIERIGAGAYGEVWRAEAPGGVIKAIKFVYGFHTENRAVRELKSLQRIKQLRHPFLLSLERFEIANGRLVIVTELADGSLKDRFVECRDAGAVGLPRFELLNHLRDAADALDFINETQSLQHLDVKAENLLLVGGRLKLGDFGLIQNLADDGGSLVEGMTPRYAAPEVFKGRPTKYSDQFSLAVVYTELLTGEAPFDAKSPADVAVQHLLGSTPMLDGLPSADRPAVLRALSRRPEERHPSCRAFVDALLAGPSLSHAAHSAGNRPVGNRRPDWQPVPGDSQPDPAEPSNSHSGRQADRSAAQRRQSPIGEEQTVVFSTDADSRIMASCPRSTASVTRLPAVEVNGSAWEARPTLFVGIGGVAGQLIRRLNRRLAERFDAHDQIHAWGTLAIDTDENALNNASGHDRAGEVSAEDTLLLNLRTTQEYREASPQILKWLSRRWLFNIPRIPRTCGWRPLGRLALADHGPRVMNRLRRAIQKFTAPDSLACSAETVGAEFVGKPVIVLVASISGGSGSGMVLDIAYALRKLAAELNIGEYTLRGVLVHATERDAAAQDLARANAFACLTELAHFNRPGCGYPGEASLELPAFPSIVPTFDEMFVAQLGDDLRPGELNDQLERVADCFYHGLATRAGSILDDLRAASRGQGELTVRTFGIFVVNSLDHDAIDGFVDGLCQVVADRWLGVGTREAPASLRYMAIIEDEGLGDKLKRQVEQILGTGADENFKLRLGEFLQECHAAPGAAASGGDLSNVRAELMEINNSLRAVRGGKSLVGSPEGDESSGTKVKRPLAGIYATVHSFLCERVFEMAANLANEIPASFFRRQRWQGEGDDVIARALSELCGHLRTTARAEIRKALQQVDVSRMLLEMCGKSRAAREPMRELLQAATPRLDVDGAAERLFVFAPSYANRTELGKFFADDMKEDAMVVHTEDSRLMLYCERECMSLRDVAASLMEHRRGYAEMAGRLHTRIDVTWTPLQVNWPADA